MPIADQRARALHHQDQMDEDESEYGCILIQSESDWRCEMARWIATAQDPDAERAADER